MTKPRIILASTISIMVLLIVVPTVFISSAKNQQRVKKPIQNGEAAEQQGARPPEKDVRGGAYGVPQTKQLGGASAVIQTKALANLRAMVGVPIQVEYNALTNTPRQLFSYNGYLSAASADDAEVIARNFLTRWQSIFRFSSDDLQNLRPLSRAYLQDAGTTVLVFQQQLNGVPFYHGEVFVNVNRNGQVISAGSESYPQVKITNSVAITPEQAIVAAAKDMGLGEPELKSLGRTEVLAAYGVLKPEYIEGQSFKGEGTFTDDIIVTRTIFPMGATGREAYRFDLTTPQFNGITWENVVDAETGEVLHRYSLTMFQRQQGASKTAKEKPFTPSFGDPSGGTLTNRRSRFRPDVQALLDSFNPMGTARGEVFDGMPTVLSGRRTCTGNPPGTNCTSTTGTLGPGFGRSPSPGTPPTYAPETETNRSNGRGFKRSLVKARTESPYAEDASASLFTQVYNYPFAQALRGLPDALNPSPASPLGWFYLPTGAGGVEITTADNNRATTQDYGYNMSAEAKARNVPENSPVPATKDQPFSATTTPLNTPITLNDGRTLSSVFQSNYTEGNNVVVADDRQNDDETTKGVKGYDPSRQFTASRFNFINSYEYGGQNPVGTGPGGGPCPPVGVGGTCSVTFPATANPDIYPGAVSLFYFNNIMHDYLYSVGFTETTFNMQQDNFGRGGTGKDGVTAQLQDGSGTDNANMSPTAEGSKPRMQMYLFTETGFRRADGSMDFDVVGHEFFHAVSNRSVGKGQTGCVGNGLVGESGGQGEGWSDYIATSMTDDDSEGEDVTGEFDVGIRRLPYTNYRWSYQSVNGNALRRRDQQVPDTAAGATPFEVHSTGELWAATLWDMRELLIMKDPNAIFFDGTRRLDANQATGTGTRFYIGNRQVRSVDTSHPIDYRASFHTTTGSGGTGDGTVPNIIASEHIVRPVALTNENNPNGPLATAVRNGAILSDKLVMRGMQLSVCNPSFVDSRDAILLADREMTGGENRSIIWRAFASHGVGMNAMSTNPQGAGGPTVVEDFTVPAGVTACEQNGPLAAPLFNLTNTTANVVTITINGGVPQTGAAKYIISRATSASGPFVTIAEIPATQTSYNDDNGGQKYNIGQIVYYQIRSSRDADENCVSPASANSITITLGIPIVPAPIFLGVDQVLDAQLCDRLVVSWNPALSANPNASVVYDVYRSEVATDAGNPPNGNGNGTTDPTFTPAPANRIAQGVQGLSYVDTGRQLDRVYYYIVQARDTNNNTIDTNNTGNRRVKFNAPTAPGFKSTPVFATENFETTTADNRFTPMLTESGNDPKGEMANFQRVTGVNLGGNLTSSVMYAPDFNPAEPVNQCGSTGGAQSDFYTQLGPLALTSTSIMDFDHFFITEASFDGGVVELKLGAPFVAGDATPFPDNTLTFDLGNYMVQGGYNARLDGTTEGLAFGSALMGRRAFTGARTLNHVRIPLEAFAPGGSRNPSSLPVYIRFRMTSDAASVVACNSGWFIDNLAINNLDPASCVAIGLGDVLISEFRTRGAGGAADEFVELYNNTDRNITVADLRGGSGWALAALPGNGATIGQVVATIPNGTILPARGHYLIANSGGYSLSDYGGTGSAAPDLSYTGDIADNTGLALFKTVNSDFFDLDNRLDAVGFTASPNFVFVSGTGITPVDSTNGEYSFVRRMPVNGASRAPAPQNTGDNRSDFVFVSTSGGAFGRTSTTAGPDGPSVLGAPGPENLSSPVYRENVVVPSYVDPTAPRTGGANRVRNASDTGPNQTFGTITFRRQFTNTTGAPVTRLRFRIVDITTLNSPNPGGAAQADLRALISGDANVTLSDGVSVVTVKGTTLEQPPFQSSNGGGVNSTYTVVLPNGGLTTSGANQSINVQFRLGVVQSGAFRFFFAVEALP